MMAQEESIIDFTKLELERVIDESSHTKSITFQGKYNGQTAVIRLEKLPFEAQATKDALSQDSLSCERNLQNDIYSRYKIQAVTRNSINDLKAIIVMPASPTVLAKYSKAETTLISETAKVYHKIVEPFISNMLETDKDYNSWVYNILEGKSEVNHIMLNDPDPQNGFVLLPSLKSSGDENEIHILAICHRRDVRSLRDLNDTHLPLLKNILTRGTEAIEQKFSNSKGRLRAYIHYHPTFYHFHVHFQTIDPSEYKCSDRDNLLATVVNNITLIPNYYHQATLTYPLSKANALFKKLEESKSI